MIRPLGRDRWTFLNNADHGDHLVHRAMAAYGATYEQRALCVYPTVGITECGIYIKLFAAGLFGGCEQGTYVDDAHMLTCIRCVSGVCTDGVSFRQMAKNDRFMLAYGHVGSVLQNPSPSRAFAATALTEREKKTLDDFKPWLALVLGKLP